LRGKRFNFNRGENIERPSQTAISQICVYRPARLSVQTAQGIQSISFPSARIKNQFAQGSLSPGGDAILEALLFGVAGRMGSDFDVSASVLKNVKPDALFKRL
jgi:hypothetical protein